MKNKSQYFFIIIKNKYTKKENIFKDQTCRVNRVDLLQVEKRMGKLSFINKHSISDSPRVGFLQTITFRRDKQ